MKYTKEEKRILSTPIEELNNKDKIKLIKIMNKNGVRMVIIE